MSGIYIVVSNAEIWNDRFFPLMSKLHQLPTFLIVCSQPISAPLPPAFVDSVVVYDANLLCASRTACEHTVFIIIADYRRWSNFQLRTWLGAPFDHMVVDFGLDQPSIQSNAQLASPIAKALRCTSMIF